jgi:Toprim domain
MHAVAGNISFEALRDLTDDRLGRIDIPCPECSTWPLRSPNGRHRRVFRVWRDDPDFASYHCARCGECGWVRDCHSQATEPASLKRLQEDAAGRDRGHVERQLQKARWLWQRRKNIEGSPAQEYLQAVRGYHGSLPGTLGFLPASKPEHHPAMIAAFGIPDEPEPGVLAIRDDQVHGVHLTLLKPDGSGKAGTHCDKLMVGASSGSPIVIASMNNLLGLVITEGIEDALSLHEATGLGAWAAGSASRIPALADAVPEYCESITVAADDDTAGKAAAGAFLEAMEPFGMCVEIILPNRRAA